jgi:SPP1 family phage portal protein
VAQIFNNSKGVVDEDGVFFYPPERNKEGKATAKLTDIELQRFINYHRSRLFPRYERLRKYYKGEHRILRQAKKELWRPDNRLLYNFPKKLVNTFGGFFLGTPARIDINSKENEAEDHTLDDWLKQVNFDDINFEVSKQIDIFGRSHYFLYQNENSDTVLTSADPRNTFVIYSDDAMREPLFAIHYYRQNRDIIGILYTLDGDYEFNLFDSARIELDKNPISRSKKFDGLPVIEAYNNEERLGLFEDVMSIIDGINHEMSEKSNDLDAQAESILKLVNVKIKDKERTLVNKNRTLLVESVSPNQPVDVGYINKADNDGLQEHLIERNIDLLYQISGVANVNDDQFGTASGTALEFKLLPMSNMADMKARKMTTAIKKMLKIAFETVDILKGSHVSEELDQVNIKFIKTTPHNLKDEAETMQTLANTGLLSDKSILRTSSQVDDPETELKEAAAERETKVKEQRKLGNTFQLDADKGDENGQADTKPATKAE